MRPFFLAAFLLLTAAGAAQTIRGTIRDSKGRPVPGASIALKGSYDGATSDSAGSFSFTTSEGGEQVLQATAIGYRNWEGKVRPETGTAPLAIVLKEDITELKAVVISAGSFE